MTGTANPVLDAALSAATAGFAVLPLHTPAADGSCDCRRPDCASPAKHPRTRDGLTGATTDPEQIRRWWALWPDANLGLSVPDGYAVVDVDTDDVDAALGGRELPPTAVQRTGRGWQFMFRTDRPVRPRVAALDHVDVRGPGSYIVAPPSRHSTGAIYTWLVYPRESVADAPAWLYELAAGPRTNGHALEGEPIPAGQRNDALASLAGSMRARGFGEPAILAALEHENAARCQPPLPAGEVAAIAHSIARYEPVDEPEVVRGRQHEPGLVPIRSIDVTPPTFVVPPYLADDDGATVLFGDGGSGKTSIAAAIAVTAARERPVAGLIRVGPTRPVVVLPYEARRGLARRIVGLLGTDEAPLFYVPESVTARPLWEAIPAAMDIVRVDLAEHGAPTAILLVDSIGFGLGKGSSRDDEPATMTAAAIARAGAKVLAVAHQNRAGDDTKPFGSAYWHNGARMTWHVRLSNNDLVLVCRKANDFDLVGRTVGYRVSWDEQLDGVLSALEPYEVKTDLATKLADALLVDRSPTLAELVTRVSADRRSVHAALSRHPDRFVKVAGDPVRWRLRDA